MRNPAYTWRGASCTNRFGPPSRTIFAPCMFILCLFAAATAGARESETPGIGADAARRGAVVNPAIGAMRPKPGSGGEMPARSPSRDDLETAGAKELTANRPWGRAT